MLIETQFNNFMLVLQSPTEKVLLLIISSQMNMLHKGLKPVIPVVMNHHE